MSKNQNMTENQAMREVSKFYLILSEGEKGHHILFSPEMIRMTFEKESDELSKLFHDNLEEINRVLNESMLIKNLDEKQDLIASQSEDLQRALVYGYFQLLEGQLGNVTLH
jgi:ketosteroid isomerase-like protein